ncbi:hypothetical protein [Ferrimonas aestuarii]|uniref:Uncharacterized protein n=1 Tax=Ferrimonas aestuarii TaxID=2569539 RepID=A0A4U1BQ46_9GAMM|nr:hypothetical protein [Ferrimonas aestuarii]TKB54762.1 hypothetical protein FCL42_11480 [Ferrimonas aestuarii]
MKHYLMVTAFGLGLIFAGAQPATATGAQGCVTTCTTKCDNPPPIEQCDDPRTPYREMCP